jgi:hypothetical protein
MMIRDMQINGASQGTMHKEPMMITTNSENIENTISIKI